MKRTPSQQAWFDARRQVGVWLTKRDFKVLQDMAAAQEQTVSSTALDILRGAIERFENPSSR